MAIYNCQTSDAQVQQCWTNWRQEALQNAMHNLLQQSKHVLLMMVVADRSSAVCLSVSLWLYSRNYVFTCVTAFSTSKIKTCQHFLPLYTRQQTSILIHTEEAKFRRHSSLLVCDAVSLDVYIVSFPRIALPSTSWSSSVPFKCLASHSVTSQKTWTFSSAEVRPPKQASKQASCHF